MLEWAGQYRGPATQLGRCCGLKLVLGGAGGPYRFHVHSLLPYAAGGVSSPITHILMRASLTLPRNSYSHAWPARSQVFLSPRFPSLSPRTGPRCFFPPAPPRLYSLMTDFALVYKVSWAGRFV